jgi:hypothetical protein
MATTIPVDELDGVAGQMKEMVTGYKTDMTAKGVDPTALLAAVDGKRSSMNAKNQEQEAARTLWKQRTEELGPLKDDVYAAISMGCDMVITAFGRTSPRGQEATRLRKQLTKRGTGGGEETPPTPPQA